MIVEDEAVTSLALEESVRRLGYEVVATVPTGEEAITTARENPLDVVLMDIRLRGVIDGVAAAQKIRKEVDVPCVYLTAYSDEETLKRAKISEPYGYIVKPYNEKELRAAIEIAIHNSAMDRERKAAHEALLTRERTLQDIIDNSPALIYLKDAEGRYTLVNRRFEAVFGVARADIRGKEDHAALPKPHRDQLARADEAVLKDGSTVQTEETLQQADGQHKYVALRFPLRRPDGSIYGVCGVMTDITDLSRMQDTLRTTEARYRLITEASADVITLSSIDGTLEYVSPACQKLLGYSPDELVGTSGYAFVHADDVERVRTTPPPEAQNFSAIPITFRARRKDGTFVPVEANIQAVGSNGHEASPMILAVTRDITERVRIQGEVDRLHAELEARVAQRTNELHLVNQQLEAFTHTVSHDLRAPVRGINYLASELEEQYAPQLGENGGRIIEQIRKESARLGALMTELLDFSRATRNDVRRSRVDLSVMARGIAGSLQREDLGRSVDFVIPGGIVAECDPLLVRLVLENLLGNAWKFTGKKAHATIEIGVTARDVPTFFVRDDGVGFDPARAPQLFQPFHRLHAQSDFPGTGLGLASVLAIVHRHGGRAWAESRPGEGATFFFTLAKSPEAM